MTTKSRYRVASALRAAPLMAATRDASWYRRPGRGGKYHIVIDGCMACAVRTTGRISGRPVVTETAELATSVPAVQRCGRPGCRERWPAHPQNPKRASR